jgi:hypothetical protein
MSLQPADCWWAEASGRVAGETARIAYIGHRDGLHYVAPWVVDKLFRGSVDREASPLPQKCTVSEALSATRADLIFIADNQDVIDSLGVEPTFVMPMRVHFVCDFGDEEARNAEQFHREKRRHRARVNRYRYSWSTTSDQDLFTWFYQRLYQPTMTRRYGARARAVPYEEAVAAIFQAGNLLLTFADEQPVAGVASRLDDAGWCFARLAGWLDASHDWLRREALKSTYHFLMDWGAQQHLRGIDFMGCEPFLTKGTYQSKRRLGTRVVVAPAYWSLRMAVLVRRANNPVRDFLINNPMLLCDPNGGLVPGFPFDQFQRPLLDLPFRCAGLGRPRLIDLGLLPSDQP